MIRTLFHTILVVWLVGSLSCGGEDCLTGSLSLNDYITENELSVTESEADPGLRYIIQDPGEGAPPILSDSISVEFVGYTTDRDTFDMTTGSQRELLLDNLILGWQIGLQLIGEGGRIQLFVPSRLGYVSNPVANICGNTDLIFEVELIDIR
jgi:FKBP-type peptidyl-prolyl cis-trans isomerase